ncbi:MAG: hypothetical protein KJO31_17280 [Gammaproteobacteria bacterium]|nr:hypothetical protein [Gammaproteobacteria bacterium]
MPRCSSVSRANSAFAAVPPRRGWVKAKTRTRRVAANLASIISVERLMPCKLSVERLQRAAAIVAVNLMAAACTTVANPGPNEHLAECSPDKQLVCRGTTGRRTGNTKDPHSVCGCAERMDRT